MVSITGHQIVDRSCLFSIAINDNNTAKFVSIENDERILSYSLVNESHEVSVPVRLNKLGNGIHEIQAKVYAVEDESEALETSEHYSFTLEGVDLSNEDENDFDIDVLTELVTNQNSFQFKASIIEDISIENGKWEVKSYVSGKPTSSVFDNGLITFELQDLEAGELPIQLDISEHSSYRITKSFDLVLVVDQIGPIIEFTSSNSITNETQPELDFTITDDGSGVDITSLKLYKEGVFFPVEFDIPTTSEDAKSFDCKLYFADPLWDGEHEFHMEAKDLAGNTSTSGKVNIHVDTSAPRILEIIPTNDSYVSPNAGINIKLSDRSISKILREPTHILVGVGNKREAIFDQMGIRTIHDLSISDQKTMTVKSIRRRVLMDILTRARIISNFDFEQELFRGIYSWTVVDILDAEPDAIASKLGIDVSKVSKLQKLLQEIHLLIDHRQHRRIRLSDFVTVKHSGVEEFKLKLNGENVSDGGQLIGETILWSTDEPLAEGQQNIEVSIVDKAGNHASKSSWFNVDATPPEILNLSPGAETIINDEKVLITATLDDVKSGIDKTSLRLLVNNEDVSTKVEFKNDVISFESEDLDEGRVSIILSCADNAGNSKEKSWDFYIDRTPIEHFVLNEELNEIATLQDTVMVDGIISERDGVTLTINGKQASIKQDLTFNLKIPLNAGANFIKAEAKDAAGNISYSNVLHIYSLEKGNSAFAGKVQHPISKKALEGVLIKDPISGKTTTSKSNGRFILPGLPNRQLFIEFTPPSSHKDDLLPTNISIYPFPNQITRLNQVINIPVSYLHEGVEIASTENKVRVSDPDLPNVSIDLSGDKIKWPEGSEHKVSIKEINADQFVGDNPEFISSKLIQLEPSGTQIDDPDGASVSMNNIDGYPSGQIVPLFIFSEESGAWEIGGFGKVSKDETKIESIPNAGIKHFSYVAAGHLGAHIDILGEGSQTQAKGDTGSLEINLPIPGFRVNGTDIKPELTYQSHAAAPVIELKGVFRGLREIASEPERIIEEPVASLNGKRTTVINGVQAFRESKLFGIKLGDELVQEDSQSQTVYLPDGVKNPFNPPPKDEWREIEGQKIKVEYTQQIIENPMTFYKVSYQNTIDHQQLNWPEAITTRYLFSSQDSSQFKIEGDLQKKGPEPTPGEPDTRESHPTLPPDFTISYYADNKVSTGKYLPTGLYNFYASYHVEGRGLSVAHQARVTQSVMVDSGWLNWQQSQLKQLEVNYAKEPTEELEDSINKIKDLIAFLYKSKGEQQSHEVTKNTTLQYSDPIDYLMNSEAGSKIVHNLSESAFGKGWKLKELQEIHQISNNKVMVIGDDENLVFHLKNTIQKLYDGKYNKIHASSDGQLLANTATEEGDSIIISLTDDSVINLPSVDLTTTRTTFRRRLETYSYRAVPIYRRRKYVIKFLWWKKTVYRNVFAGFNWIPLKRLTPFLQSGSPKETVQSIKADVSGMAHDKDNNLIISDIATHRIYQVNTEGELAVIAGSTKVTDLNRQEHGLEGGYRRDSINIRGNEVDARFTIDGSSFDQASLFYPAGVVVDGNNDIVFCESGNPGDPENGSNRIRKLNKQTGKLETIAGTGHATYNPDVILASEAAIPLPSDLAIDSNDSIYVLMNLGDEMQAVGKVDPQGYFTHIVGNTKGTIDSGVHSSYYKLVGATGITINDKDELVITLKDQRKVIMIDQLGFVSELAGNGKNSKESGDGGYALRASLSDPVDCCFTPDGNLLILDNGRESVRHVAFAIDDKGFTEFAGPKGHFKSSIRKLTDGTWERYYRQDKKTIRFDHLGKHICTEDKNGHQINYEYDALLRLSKAAYPHGNFLEFNYENGVLSQIKDHTGKATDIVQSNQMLTKVDYPDATSTEFVYDGEGRITKKVDHEQNESTFSYNKYGKLINETHGETSIVYDRPEDIVSGNEVIDSPEIKATTSETSTKIESAEVLSTSSQQGSTARQYTNREISLKNNGFGLPEKLTRPNDTSILYSYDGQGNLAEIHDEALDASKKYTYDEFGNKIGYRDEEGRVMSWEYDERGNIVEQKIGENSIVHIYDYDELGYLTSKSEYGIEEQFEYDEQGNKSKYTIGESVSDFIRDELGNILSETVGGERKTEYLYDAFNRVIQVKTEDQEVNYTYDSNGNLRSCTDPQQRQLEFEYDKKGNRVESSFPDGRTVEKVYDKENRISWQSGPTGIPHEHEYIKADNTEVITAGDEKIKIRRWENNRLVATTHGDISIEKGFDQSGRPNGEQFHFRNSPNIRILNSLDKSGKITQVKSPGMVSRIKYDEHGLPIKLSIGLAFEIELVYDEHGRLSTVTKSNGHISSYSYLPSGNLKSVVHEDSLGSTTETYFEYNQFNECIRVDEAGQVIDYDYDRFGRLVSESGAETNQYQFDDSGNRTHKNGNAYSYDSSKTRLLEDDQWNYVYDDYGNLIQKTNRQTNQSFDYSFTAFGKLKEVEIKEDNQLVKSVLFTYDGEHRRVGKEVIDHQESANGYQRWYLYQKDQLYLELDANYDVVRQYLIDPNTEQVFGFKEGDKDYFYVKGYLEDVQQVLDEEGNVIASYQYDAYGNIISSNESISNSFRYRSLWFDEEIGTYHFLNREYDPFSGRFITPDPYEGETDKPLSIYNSYVYAANNPIKYIDFKGLNFFKRLGSIIAGAVISIVGAIVFAVAFLVTLVVLPVILAIAHFVGVIAATFVGPFHPDGPEGVYRATFDAVKGGLMVPFAGLMGLGMGLFLGGYAMITGADPGAAFENGFNYGWQTGHTLFASVKWKLVRPRETVRGIMENSEEASDGDINVFISPYEPYKHLLANENGVVNPVRDIGNGKQIIECEIEVNNDHKGRFLSEVSQFKGIEMYASGVYINDWTHNGRTELHPVDVFVVKLPEIYLTGDARFKHDDLLSLNGTGLFVHKIFMASDDSFMSYPPLSDTVRDVNIIVPLPDKPTSPGLWHPSWKLDEIRNKKVYLDDVQMKLAGNNAYLEINTELYPLKEGGPSVFIGDFHTYWEKIG